MAAGAIRSSRWSSEAGTGRAAARASSIGSQRLEILARYVVIDDAGDRGRTTGRRPMKDLEAIGAATEMSSSRSCPRRSPCPRRRSAPVTPWADNTAAAQFEKRRVWVAYAPFSAGRSPGRFLADVGGIDVASDGGRTTGRRRRSSSVTTRPPPTSRVGRRPCGWPASSVGIGSVSRVQTTWWRPEEGSAATLNAPAACIGRNQERTPRHSPRSASIVTDPGTLPADGVRDGGLAAASVVHPGRLHGRFRSVNPRSARMAARSDRKAAARRCQAGWSRDPRSVRPSGDYPIEIAARTRQSTTDSIEDRQHGYGRELVAWRWWRMNQAASILAATPGHIHGR
jgi:hypothetical protein